MRVIGIDPGLVTTGWGLIETDGVRMRHIANGLCRSGDGDLGPRLLSLYRQIRAVLAAERPDAGAIEQTFVNRDGAGTLKLCQARGVALLALAEAGFAVGEYSPNAVKKTVVGVGHAGKEQVAHMVRMQLPGCEPAGPDAADALAIALCHAYQSRGMRAKVKA